MKKTNKKGKQTNEVINNKLKEEIKKEKKIPLRGFSLRRYVVTRYAVTRFTNNLIAYLLLLSRRNTILMSPAAVSGQTLYLEIARTRSDGKLDLPSQSRVQTAKNDQKIDRLLC